jgi:hypothetical protein
MQASMIAVTEYCIQQHLSLFKSVHKHKSTHCKLSELKLGQKSNKKGHFIQHRIVAEKALL